MGYFKEIDEINDKITTNSSTLTSISYNTYDQLVASNKILASFSATPVISTKFVDTNGNSINFKNIDGKPRVSSTDYLYDIAEGNINGHSKITKVGYNSDIDNTLETMWGYGGLYVFPSTPLRMEVVSSSTDDSSSGIGARTVHIHYLDNNYVEHEELVALNGTNAVGTVATNIYRINSFHVNTAGSNNTSVGNLTVRNFGGATVYGYILAGYNNSQMSIHTVPYGKTMYLVGWNASCGSNLSTTFITFRLMANCDNNENLYSGNIFHVKDIMSLKDGRGMSDFKIPFKIPSTCDVVITAIGETSNTNAICSSRFHGWQE